MDRVEEWRIFATVAGLRSFAEAARKLGKSPQAITRAVAGLEQRLETRLLHRTTRSVSLTNDGERYLDKSRGMLAEFDALEAAEASTELRGAVSITAPVLFGQLHVAPLVTEFLRKQPGVTARLLLLDRVVSLAEEGIDVGIRIGGLADSALLSKLVGHVRSVIVASPEYLARAGTPRSPDALAKHACIAFTPTTPIPDRWAFPGSSRERAIAVQTRLVVNTGQAAIDAALAGLGLVRVLSYQVDKLVAQDRLRIVLANHEPEPAPIQLVSLPGRRSRVAAAFHELAATRLAVALAKAT